MDSKPPNVASPIAGFLLAVPGLLFVAANVLKHYAGTPFLYDSISPAIENGGLLLDVVIVGGLLIALLLSLVPILRLGLRRDRESLVGTVALRVSWVHLAVAGLSLALIAVLGLYLVSENLPCIIGQRAYC